MNIAAPDWIQAQNLLVKLVKGLSPLTLQEIPNALFVKSAFVMPQSYSPDDFFTERNPVQILTTLHEVQQSLGNWIAEEMPAHPTEKPLQQLAKELINQVQQAIGRLATSNYIRDPQKAPLVSTLREIKPKLDQIIEAVHQEPERKKSTQEFEPRSIALMGPPVPFAQKRPIIKKRDRKKEDKNS